VRRRQPARWVLTGRPGFDLLGAGATNLRFRCPADPSVFGRRRRVDAAGQLAGRPGVRLWRVLDLPPQKVNPAATVRDPAALGVVRIGDRIFAVCVLADES
jgi:hypothetical protein